MVESKLFYKRQVEVLTYVYLKAIRNRLREQKQIVDDIDFEQKLFGLVALGTNPRNSDLIFSALKYIQQKRANPVEEHIVLQYLEIGFGRLQRNHINSNYYRYCLNQGYDTSEVRHQNINPELFEEVQESNISNKQALLLLSMLTQLIKLFDARAPFMLLDLNKFMKQFKEQIKYWKDNINE